MESPITCIGISHRTAPLAIRELLCCAPEAIYRDWHESSAIEMVVLSTCNRLEVYMVHDFPPPDPLQVGLDVLSTCEGQALDNLACHFYTKTGVDAAEHLCRVAAGLESQVLGEAQILGQVVNAYSAALEHGAAGPYLSALFQTAIRAGKRARSETDICRRPVSLSSAAIAAAFRLYPDLRERAVLVIGAGEMAQLAVKSLEARAVTRLLVANRTQSRATHLAALVGGHGYGLDVLPDLLTDVDVVITATGAPHTIIDRAILAASPRAPGHELLLIDIALPRDVNPDVRHLPGVRVMDMDDLKRQVDHSLVLRQTEMPKVSQIIAEELEVFENRLRQLEVRPVIIDLRQKAEMIRRRELERATRHLGPLLEETAAELERFSRSLVNKLLHDPTAALRDKASYEEGVAEYVQTVRELFDLNNIDRS
ncbi:MAG: glutamyl-tRNA reductase [Chloroflexota bacterium]